MKRQRIEIMAQILAFCIHATRKTRIMHKNNLNHAQLKDYLTLLISRGLLAHNSDTYVTTEKGHRFLEAFAQLNDVLEDHTLRVLVNRLWLLRKMPQSLGTLIACEEANVR